MKHIKFILSIILIVILLTSNVYAINSFTLEDIFKGAIDFKESAVNNVNGAANADMQTLVSSFVKQFASIFIGLAVIIMIIWGLFIGIGFMSGTAMNQANVKEALTPYVIGCIVVFGGWTIWAILVQIFDEL